jgi:hypothetical protein
MRRASLAVLVASLAIAPWLAPAPSAAVPPPGAPKCRVFPRDNVWHADVSRLPVNKHSRQWLSSMSASSTNLHPDFGPSGGFPYGLPYTTVSGAHRKIRLRFTYASESDKGPYPFGPDTPIEGGKNAGGDRHAIMIDRDHCVLYELYDAHYSSSGSTAGSGAIWSLSSNKLRPATWTSADAAGLPKFPGLVRLDVVEKKGVVDHAIRFTAARTRTQFIWPARHQAGESNDPSLPPMGARFRLKAGFPIKRYRKDTQVILRAMKRYGLILADNGSNWYFQGTAQKGWPNAMLDELKSIPAGAFVAVDESSLIVSKSSGRVRSTG